MSSSGSTDFFEVVHGQRACRAFRPDPLPPGALERILTAATMAPSSENVQPWVFVAVTDAGARGRLGRIMKELWDAGRASRRRAAMDPTMRADLDVGLGEGAIADAPVLVVVGADLRLVDRRWLSSSIYPCVQNLLLAAYAIGAASALTTIATMRADDVREVVGFPVDIEPVAVVPIGFPARRLSPPRRRPLDTCAHADRYGEPLRTDA